MHRGNCRHGFVISNLPLVSWSSFVVEFHGRCLTELLLVLFFLLDLLFFPFLDEQEVRFFKYRVHENYQQRRGDGFPVKAKSRQATQRRATPDGSRGSQSLHVGPPV